MGHKFFPTLTITKAWEDVIGLLDTTSELADLAQACADATDTGLEKSINDPLFNYTFWLLTQLPSAAYQSNFSQALQRIKIETSQSPSLYEIIGAFSKRVNEYAREIGVRSDVGEMALSAALEALTRGVREKSTSLFSTTSIDVQSALRSFSQAENFGYLGHEFFSRFTYRYTNYHLQRILFSHVGHDKHISDIHDHAEFDQAFKRHCHEAAFIVRKFSGYWYAKHQYPNGIELKDLNSFTPVALKKIRSELKRREAVYDQ